jgi:16S rRNA (guanine527-N7)-methyltransferase
LSRGPAGLADLGPEARASLGSLVEALASDPRAPSSVRDRETAWKVHIADSLAGLEFDELREATAIADVGAGAGFPG